MSQLPRLLSLQLIVSAAADKRHSEANVRLTLRGMNLTAPGMTFYSWKTSTTMGLGKLLHADRRSLKEINPQQTFTVAMGQELLKMQRPMPALT